MDNKMTDAIQGLTNAFREMDNSCKEFIETSHNVTVLLLKNQLAALYTDFYMYKARAVVSNFAVRWYWKLKAKRQGSVLRKYIESLPESIKYDVTRELLEINDNR